VGEARAERDALHEREPIDLGHLEVGDHHVHVSVLEDLERFSAVARVEDIANRNAARTNGLAQKAPHEGGVVDHEHVQALQGVSPESSADENSPAGSCGSKMRKTEPMPGSLST